MLEPVFIATAEQVIEDRGTNLVSLINLTEALLATVPSTGEMRKPLELKCVALWRRDADDPSDGYEGQFSLTWPGQEPKLAHSVEFGFGKGLLFRMMLNMVGGPRLPQPGLLVVECRARKKGDPEWLTQAARIPLEVVKAEPTEQIASVEAGIRSLVEQIPDNMSDDAVSARFLDVVEATLRGMGGVALTDFRRKAKIIRELVTTTSPDNRSPVVKAFLEALLVEISLQRQQ